MAILSHQTTYISNLEIGNEGTGQAYILDARLVIPSDGTLDAVGNIVVTGDVDASSGDLLARVDDAVGSIFTGAGGAAGAFSFVSNSANSVVLVVRSGLTMYQFWNTHAQTGA